MPQISRMKSRTSPSVRAPDPPSGRTRSRRTTRLLAGRPADTDTLSAFDTEIVPCPPVRRGAVEGGEWSVAPSCAGAGRGLPILVRHPVDDAPGQLRIDARSGMTLQEADAQSMRRRGQIARVGNAAHHHTRTADPGVEEGGVGAWRHEPVQVVEVTEAHLGALPPVPGGLDGDQSFV